MAKYVTVSEMQAIERQADASGLSYAQMMENAGRGLAEQVLEAYGYLDDLGVLALVGSGNNGGDALVALAYLAGWGWRSSAFIVRPRPKDDPLVGRLLQAGGTVAIIEDDPDLAGLRKQLEHFSVLLDGVLGTGFRLPLKDDLAHALRTVRQFMQDTSHDLAVVAVDCPSGVDCDTGTAADEVIPADMTVTMAAVKAGLLSFPAADLVGELRVVGIGPLESLPAWQSVQRRVIDAAEVSASLPVRLRNAHKGTFGTALVVAGSVNYPGAARLAGEAAYRVGAGLVTMAVPEPLYPILAGHLPECHLACITPYGWSDRADAAQLVSENLGRYSHTGWPGLAFTRLLCSFWNVLCCIRIPGTPGRPH
jgi:NAD(P)H-hydrate epimerase